MHSYRILHCASMRQYWIGISRLLCFCWGPVVPKYDDAEYKLCNLDKLLSARKIPLRHPSRSLQDYLPSTFSTKRNPNNARDVWKTSKYTKYCLKWSKYKSKVVKKRRKSEYAKRPEKFKKVKNTGDLNNFALISWLLTWKQRKMGLNTSPWKFIDENSVRIFKFVSRWHNKTLCFLLGLLAQRLRNSRVLKLVTACLFFLSWKKNLLHSFHKIFPSASTTHIFRTPIAFGYFWVEKDGNSWKSTKSWKKSGRDDEGVYSL